MKQQGIDIVAACMVLACEAHEGQMYGDVPYCEHLKDVSSVLLEFGYHDPELIGAAWLHDVVEDTDCTVETLLVAGIPLYTVVLVDAVTEPTGCRAIRHQFAYPRIARIPDAVTLKLADRIANVRACIARNDSRGKMYAKEHDGFRGALRSNGGNNFAMWTTLDNHIRELRG